MSIKEFLERLIAEMDHDTLCAAYRCLNKTLELLKHSETFMEAKEEQLEEVTREFKVWLEDFEETLGTYETQIKQIVDVLAPYCPPKAECQGCAKK